MGRNLKRIVVIDVGEGPIVLINPVITETDGEQTGDEGCLAPGKVGAVTRPNHVKVEAYNEDMEKFETGSARSFWQELACHECEHLKRVLYVEHVQGELRDTAAEYDEDEEE